MTEGRPGAAVGTVASPDTGRAALDHAGAAAEQREAATDAVRARMAEHGVHVVIVGGCDMPGVFRAKRLPVSRFAAAPDARVGFSDYLFGIDVEEQLIPREPGYESWWPSWDTGLAEIYAVPDLSTFRVAGWLDGTAVVLCDYEFPDGRPVEISPRYVLRHITEQEIERGLLPKIGPEPEFFIYRETGETLREKGYRNLTPLFTRGSGYGAYRHTLDEEVLRPLRDHLADFGITPEGSNPESGGGQYEIQLVYCPLPEAADRAFLFKHAVKEMAGLNGMMATFLSKASPLEFGSSLHLHQSLWDGDERNLFFDGDATTHLSQLARHFVGGQLATMRELTPMFAPTITAYKRLQPDSAAGTTVSWGYENRTTGLRAIAEDPAGARVEHRVPGGDANPYLAMAAALAGGLYGIDQKIEPPEPIVGNAYARDDVATLPSSLAEAVELFAASDVAKHYLGEEFVRFYAATLRWELTQFNQHLTDWEVKRYLEYL